MAKLKHYFLGLFFFSLFAVLPIVGLGQVGQNIGSDFEEVNQGYIVRRKTSILFDAQLGPLRIFRPGVKFIGFRVRKVPVAGTVVGIESPNDGGNTCPSCLWDVVKDDNGSVQFTVSGGNWYASPRLDRLPRSFRFTTNQATATTVIELEWEEYIGVRRVILDTGSVDLWVSN